MGCGKAGEGAEFEPGALWVEEEGDAVAGEELAAGLVPGDGLGGAFGCGGSEVCGVL